MEYHVKPLKGIKKRGHICEISDLRSFFCCKFKVFVMYFFHCKIVKAKRKIFMLTTMLHKSSNPSKFTGKEFLAFICFHGFFAVVFFTSVKTC